MTTHEDGLARRDAGTAGPLAALSLSVLLASLGTSIANVALPALAEDLAAPLGQLQWVVLAYLLAGTVLVVGIGRLGDIYGRRRVLLTGLALFIAASGLCGLAPTLPWLIAARALQGLGAAAMMALAMALVVETVPRERIGGTMGLLGTMSAAGTALGPSLGGLIIFGFGWRAIFLAVVPLGLLSLVLAWRYLPQGGGTAQPGRQRFNVAGTALFAAMLVAYALAMTAGTGAFGLQNAALLVVTVMLGVLFARVERKATSPLIRPGWLKKPGIGARLAVNILVAAVMMTTLVVGPFFLARTLGLGPAGTGLVMAVGPLVSIASGGLAGRIVDRFGASAMIPAGLAAMAVGTMGLSVLPAAAGLIGYIAAIAMLTPGYQLFQAANNTAVMADAAADERGVASSLLSLSRNLGLIAGASLMGAVFANATGAQDMAGAAPAAVAAGTRATFALAAVFLLLGLAIVLIEGRRRAPR
jgi:MFS family permease